MPRFLQLEATHHEGHVMEPELGAVAGDPTAVQLLLAAVTTLGPIVGFFGVRMMKENASLKAKLEERDLDIEEKNEVIISLREELATLKARYDEQ